MHRGAEAAAVRATASGSQHGTISAISHRIAHSVPTRAFLRTVPNKELLIILNYHRTPCGGLAVMQIRSLMQPGAFGPEAIAVMGDALDAALKELQDAGQSDIQSDVVREIIAGRIIGAARLGERDPARLRAAALSGVTGRRDYLFRPLSKQHSPTPQNEAEHPEQRRHDVDGDEHAKHQRVVEERRSVPIDRDRRDRLTRMFHEVE